MAAEETSGFSRDLWSALYGALPISKGMRLTLPQVSTPEAMKLLNEGAAFLSSTNSEQGERLKLEAVMPGLSERILERRTLKAPVG